MKKIFCLFSMLCLLAACSDGGSSGGGSHEKSSPLESITVSNVAQILKMESTLTLPETATATYEDKTTRSVKVTYSLKDSTVDGAIISLDATTRVVTPVAKGSATIVASYTEGGVTKTYDIAITVKDKDAPDLLRIAVTASKTTLDKDETATLTTKGIYSDDSQETVTASYTVAPSNAGSITNGVFTAGEVTADTEVTITATFDGKTATVKITVKAPVIIPPALVSIAVTISNNIIKMGNTLTLPEKATATYDDKTTKEVAVTYALKDANNGKITLDAATRVVTPAETGNAVIVASYTDGELTKTYDIAITVVAANAPDLSSIKVSANKTTLEYGESILLSTEGTYSNSTTGAVEANYSVSPIGAGIISGNTFTAGEVKTDTEVTITASYGGKTNTVKVTVKKAMGSAGIDGDFN